MHEDGEWNHNIHYHALVLRCVPTPCHRALDVGCGRGDLTRKLAGRCDEVIGVDLQVPASRTSGTVTFVVDDFMQTLLAPRSFDFVCGIAVLHHLELGPALERIKNLLSPGGVLCIIGLYRPTTPLDVMWSISGWVASRVVRLRRGYRTQACLQQPPRESLACIRQVAARILPAATVKRRLFFRYSLTWQKPQKQSDA